MVAAIDCMCWTEDCCITRVDWRSWWGLLEASLLSWWPGLVALDLVQPIQPFVIERPIAKIQIALPHRRHQLMLHGISRLNVPTLMGLLVVVKTYEDEHTIKGDQGGPAKNPPMAKLVSSKNRVPTLLEVKSHNTHLPWFDSDWSLYREPWSGYWLSNFPKIRGN